MLIIWLLTSGLADAEIIGGVEFPQGEVSFADVVVSFIPGTGGVMEPASNALGVPDDDNVSIGNGGVLILRFTDNRLVDQTSVEGGLDLFIFEAGAEVEAMDVAISKDGSTFIEVGRIEGQPAGIDIGPFVASGDEFRFVRITDVAADMPQTGEFAGADIEAVGAIGSLVVRPVPALSGWSQVSLVALLLAAGFLMMKGGPTGL